MKTTRTGTVDGIARSRGLVYPFVLMAMLISGFPASASTYFFTGNDLVRLMREYERRESQDPRAKVDGASLYVGFVIGVHDSLGVEAFCSPEDVGGAQVSAVVTKYMNAHPEEWNKPAWLLVTTALKQAFPCRK